MGAGCGETAFLYLNHGAEKVICIEPEGEALECLKKNFSKDSRVVIVPAFLNSIRIDIEGYEEGLVMETHFPAVFKKLAGDPVTTTWRVQRRGAGPYSFLLVRTGPRLHKARIAIAHAIRGLVRRLYNP